MIEDPVEGIRQRITALIDDAQQMQRKARRLKRATAAQRAEMVEAIVALARHVNQSSRELYHLLPEHLRPTDLPREQAPREEQPDAPRRAKRPPTPGGVLPREVRWPRLTVEGIRSEIYAYHERNGKWPTGDSGRVKPDGPDTWCGYDLALSRGNRGLLGGSSLADLVAECSGHPKKGHLPNLTEDQILAWLDLHVEAHGKWPVVESGPIDGELFESWRTVDQALRRGKRGLPGGSSLARLLAERRGRPNIHDRTPLTMDEIAGCAAAEHERSGQWVTKASGPVLQAPGEDWASIDQALREGRRSLPEGSSLARLLAERFGVRNRKALPPFDLDTLAVWARNHQLRRGRLPAVASGPIEESPGDTWRGVDDAFKNHGRGLVNTGFRSLAHFLQERLGKPFHPGRPGSRKPKS